MTKESCHLYRVGFGFKQRIIKDYKYHVLFFKERLIVHYIFKKHLVISCNVSHINFQINKIQLVSMSAYILIGKQLSKNQLLQSAFLIW